MCVCLFVFAVKINQKKNYDSLLPFQSRRSFEHGQCTAFHSLTGTWLDCQLQRKNQSYCVLLYVRRSVCTPFVTVGSDIMHATQPLPLYQPPASQLNDSANVFWRVESVREQCE